MKLPSRTEPRDGDPELLLGREAGALVELETKI